MTLRAQNLAVAEKLAFSYVWPRTPALEPATSTTICGASETDTHRASVGLARSLSIRMLALAVATAFFGLVLEAVHAALTLVTDVVAGDVLLTTLEEGGRLVVLSLATASMSQWSCRWWSTSLATSSQWAMLGRRPSSRATRLSDRFFRRA